MTDYFISVIYPDYQIGTRIGTYELGHTGLAYVNGDTGQIRYFDFGRYPINDESTNGVIVEPLASNGYPSITVSDIQSGNFTS